MHHAGNGRALQGLIRDGSPVQACCLACSGEVSTCRPAPFPAGICNIHHDGRGSTLHGPVPDRQKNALCQSGKKGEKPRLVLTSLWARYSNLNAAPCSRATSVCHDKSLQ